MTYQKTKLFDALRRILGRGLTIWHRALNEWTRFRNGTREQER